MACETLASDTGERWRQAKRVRNYLLLSLTVGLVWGYVLLWVIQHYRIAGNETDSLPDKFFLVELGRYSIMRGDLLAFHVGERVRHYPTGMVFIKRVVGMPGDRIEWFGDTVQVAGQPVGKAKPQNRFGEPLGRTPAGVIPAGHYFVATQHPDSYDSRYADVGLVQDSQRYGRVIW